MIWLVFLFGFIAVSFLQILFSAALPLLLAFWLIVVCTFCVVCTFFCILLNGNPGPPLIRKRATAAKRMQVPEMTMKRSASRLHVRKSRRRNKGMALFTIYEHGMSCHAPHPKTPTVDEPIAIVASYFSIFHIYQSNSLSVFNSSPGVFTEIPNYFIYTPGAIYVPHFIYILPHFPIYGVHRSTNFSNLSAKYINHGGVGSVR